MDKFFNLRFAYHEMLRTKCFNFYLVILGYYFQLGIYPEYSGDLEGNYLGFKVAIHIPVKPWRFYFFVPSFSLIEDTASYFMSLDGNYNWFKRVGFANSRYIYRSKN